MGNGFPVEKVPPAEVPYLFIFATGTGIGPIKALIESHSLKVYFQPCPHRGRVLRVDGDFGLLPLQHIWQHAARCSSC